MQNAGVNLARNLLNTGSSCHTRHIMNKTASVARIATAHIPPLLFKSSNPIPQVGEMSSMVILIWPWLSGVANDHRSSLKYIFKSMYESSSRTPIMNPSLTHSFASYDRAPSSLIFSRQMLSWSMPGSSNLIVTYHKSWSVSSRAYRHIWLERSSDSSSIVATLSTNSSHCLPQGSGLTHINSYSAGLPSSQLKMHLSSSRSQQTWSSSY